MAAKGSQLMVRSPHMTIMNLFRPVQIQSFEILSISFAQVAVQAEDERLAHNLMNGEIDRIQWVGSVRCYSQKMHRDFNK